MVAEVPEKTRGQKAWDFLNSPFALMVFDEHSGRIIDVELFRMASRPDSRARESTTTEAAALGTISAYGSGTIPFRNCVDKLSAL
jgi:hypothetical protein